MCGIIGYIGNKTIDEKLVRLLKKLEYRGYDSAGIATCTHNTIEVTKSVGKIENLQKILKHNSKAKCGIAHTRWATHGIPKYENTHPLLSNNNKWAVVHNGIIENYSSIKKSLIKKGYSFYGETDTEIIANLLEQNDSDNKILTLIKTCNYLSGSYAILCIKQGDDQTLYMAKKKSPLYIAQNNKEVIVASDPICFAGKMDEYYSLHDDEFASANLKNIVFYNKNGVKINKKPQKIDNFDANISKNEYPHYMLKEINETPNVLKNISKIYFENQILKKFNKQFINNFNNIVLIGCGTAYHAALIGEKYIEYNTGILCHSYVASEYRYKKPNINKNTLCILISQSGETADTLAVCDLVKSYGATTIAVTNVLYSTLAKSVKYVLPVCAGPEIAVASTKAYTAQIAILYMFSKQLYNAVFNKRFNYIDKIGTLAHEIIIPSLNELNPIAEELKDQKNAFFIGRDFDYITCEESSLKLKEISYINCSAHPAGELKHGFLALIEDGSIVFVFASIKNLVDKTINGANEAKARGAKIILISNLNFEDEQLSGVYRHIKIQNTDEELMPMVMVLYGQTIAYLTSIKKGINPDQPRNLAKSVTVE